MMLFVTASLGGFAVLLADQNGGLDETVVARRDAVAGAPATFELRSADAAGGRCALCGSRWLRKSAGGPRAAAGVLRCAAGQGGA